MSEESILTQIYNIRLSFLRQRITIKEFILTRKALKMLHEECASMTRLGNMPKKQNRKRWYRGAAYGIPVRPALFSERQELPIVTIT